VVSKLVLTEYQVVFLLGQEYDIFLHYCRSFREAGGGGATLWYLICWNLLISEFFLHIF